MNKEKIAKNLIDLRKKRNMSQKQASEQIGISCSALAMYESGQRIPRDEVKIKIADFYKKSVTSIFYT